MKYQRINQRVITKRDILAHKNAPGIIVSESALITDEAKDYAAKEKIEIMKMIT